MSKVKHTFRIKTEVSEQVRKHSDKTGITLSRIVEDALLAYLQGDKKARPSTNKYTEEFTAYMAFYNKVMSKSFTATDGRKRKFAARRKTFELKDIYDATRNISESAFHMGYNENDKFYATPDFILRSDEQVDKWREESNIWK